MMEDMEANKKIQLIVAEFVLRERKINISVIFIYVTISFSKA